MRPLEGFPPCIHRTQGGGFWDGTDEHGKHVGGMFRSSYCKLKLGGTHLFGLTPEECHACRQQPTQGTLDSLSSPVVYAAVKRYAEIFEQWQKGIRVEIGDWAQATSAIHAEVRARADELQAEGAFPAADREEHLVGAAVVRGLIFGWCLCEAAKAAVGDAE